MSAEAQPRDELAGVEALPAALAGLGELVARRGHPYASSWPLERLTLRDAAGGERDLLLKRFGRSHPAKPRAVCDPEREIAVYRHLGGAGLGTPRCYASGRWWLALELVDAPPLWQADGLLAWCWAAGWAARLHGRFRGRKPSGVPLRRLDGRAIVDWFDRACVRHADLAELAGAVAVARQRLEALPLTVVHGELYPANVLVAPDRVTAVDWEMAAWAPAVIDLAALISGWGEPERATIIRAFGGADARDLAAAELFLALQWLGWSPDWRPPDAQRHDWRAEARRAALALA